MARERDRRDRRTLRSALVSGGIDRVTYTHRGSRDESLLALPDAIGWASGAARSWSRLVIGILEVRNVDEKG